MYIRGFYYSNTLFATYLMFNKPFLFILYVFKNFLHILNIGKVYNPCELSYVFFCTWNCNQFCFSVMIFSGTPIKFYEALTFYILSVFLPCSMWKVLSYNGFCLIPTFSFSSSVSFSSLSFILSHIKSTKSKEYKEL